MKKVRILINAQLNYNEVIEILDADFHYLTKVMRKTVDDHILVFNSKDGEWLAQITNVDKKRIQLTVLSQIRKIEKEANLKLIFAPIKNPETTWIVTKAVELGVTEIQPILTMRSVVTKVNLEKLNLAAKEATEQCERLKAANINNMTSFEQAINSHNGDFIFLDETGSGLPPKSALSRPLNNPAMVIGPEGGFDHKELDFAKTKSSCILLSLGNRILRSETAIIAGLSLFQGYLGDW